MSLTLHLRRAGTIAAATAAAFAIAAPSYAHHCYKLDWQGASYSQHLKGNTPWQPMTDYVEDALVGFGMPDACLAHAHEFVEEFMDAKGLAQEPMIQVQATVGGGAYERNGKAPKPFGYLTDEDFGMLESLLGAEPDCQPGV